MQKTKANIILLFLLLLFCYMVIISKLFYIQLIKHDLYKKRSLEQRLRVVTLSPDRGDIYDRNGNLLATTIDSYSIFANPANITDKKTTALLLSRILGTDQASIYAKINTDKPFVWIKRKIDSQNNDRIDRLNLAGIGALKERKRIYPRTRLASQVIGFVGIDNQGLAGIEFQYNSYLRGQEGRLVTEKDRKGRDILTSVLRDFKVPSNGMNLTLTIDEPIQFVTEKALREAVKKSKAKAGTAIVMNVKNGEILALATYPDFDPNEYNKFREVIWINRAIADSYEPGSTFKLVTIACAIHQNVITPNSSVYCPASMKIGGKIIKNSHQIKLENHYVLPEDILKESINTGAAQIALKIGEDKFYKGIKKFGFGEYSGIDLPGESRGILRDISKWNKVDVGTISFGQGIAVTPIQLIASLSSLANGGVRVRPIIVKKIESPNKSYIKIFATEKLGMTVSPATAKKVLMMSEKVIKDGTGKTAKVEHFRVGGKTGTAQKAKAGGQGYYSNYFIPSFIGFAPLSDPELSVLVVIDGPEEEYWGEKVAAPVFKEIMDFSLRYLNISPDNYAYGTGLDNNLNNN